MNEVEYQEDNLEKEINEENELSEKLNKNILKKFFYFIICGLIFVLLYAFNIKNKLSISTYNKLLELYTKYYHLL